MSMAEPDASGTPPLTEPVARAKGWDAAHDHSTTPVLLVVFNRPAATRRVIDALRHSRPGHLFIAADGPRADYAADRALVDEVRDVVDEIDWDCTIRTRCHADNVGLQAAMIGAIDWFFDEVEAGVILEDDCVPAPSFLPVASDLLERYADCAEVMHISGLNMAPGRHFAPHSYGFAEVGHIWGWATWRRAWRVFDPDLSTWPEARHEFLSRASPLHRVLARKFDSAHAGRKRTWSRAWYWTTLSRGGLATIPTANLIENIGDGADATHGPTRRHPLRRPAGDEVALPLSHPRSLTVDPVYERLLVRYHRGSYRPRAEDLIWSVRRSWTVAP